MNEKQIYVLSIADRLEPGQERWFSEELLRAGFAIEADDLGSLEAAVCSHLSSSYTFRKDDKSHGYLLSRLA